MNFWIFSSKNVENIEVAKERLLWSFWDRETGPKFRRNWRALTRLYNKIKPFDVVIFQIAGKGEIHGIGIVRETFFDNQTPVWPNERNKILYPWKIAFSTIIYSEKPFTSHYIRIENYVDGYGIGELPEHEFRTILDEIQKQTNIKLNFGVR